MNKPFVIPPLPTEGQPTAKVDLSEVMHKRLDKLEAIIERGFGEQAANHDLLVGEVKTVNARVTSLEERVGRTSDRVKGESQTNLDQSRDIAAVITKVEKLETTQAQQLAILTRLDAVAANPTVRKVAYALATALLAYLAAKGWIVK